MMKDLSDCASGSNSDGLVFAGVAAKKTWEMVPSSGAQWFLDKRSTTAGDET